MRKYLLTIFLLFGGLGCSSSFAVYLTESNVVSIGAGNCNLTATNCDLSSKSITGIAPDTFINHTNLTTLNLIANQITSIESGDFNGLPSLTTLWLNHNQMTGIESSDFNGLSSLVNLTLNNNQITHIRSGTFYGLTGLGALTLQYNEISEIENGGFAGLTGITILQLQNNQLTSIESGDFNGLFSLATLYIQNNQLTSIESGDFNGLPALTTLYIRNNHITSIESGDFNGLSSLVNLDFSENQLTKIESGDFNGLFSLTTLWLNNNQITSIESDDFNGLPSLTTLGLNNNQITSIESGILSEIPGLTYFMIAYNCLDTGALSPQIVELGDISREDTSRQDTEYVCIAIAYNPSTDTSGPVTGTLIFTGGKQSARDSLYTTYPFISDTYHVWTGNGNYSFDIGMTFSDPLLHHTNIGYSILTGNVSRIIAGLKSFFEGCEDNPICSRLNVKINEFNFGETRKDIIELNTPYGLTINVRNNLGRGTYANDAILIPGGFRYRLNEFIPTGETKSLNLKVKYFKK